MTYSRSIASLALIAALCTGSAYAQTAPAQPPAAPPAQAAPAPAADDGAKGSGAPAFSELDKEGKGRIGRSDIPKDVDSLKELRAHLSDYDSNHDGKIDKNEYGAYLGKGAQPQR